MKPMFMELRVWQEAKALAVEIYKLTYSWKGVKDYSFIDQIRKASVSVASNIAEGNERNSDKDYIRFLYIAKGSLAELITQLIIAREINYITDEEYKTIYCKCTQIMKMLSGLIKSKNITRNMS